MKLELTWDKSRKRWKKKYKGKQFYFNYGKNKSDLKGYRSALSEWFKIRAGLDTKPHSDVYERRIEDTRNKLSWWEKFGVDQQPEMAEKEIRHFQKKLNILETEFAKPVPRSFSDLQSSHMILMDVPSSYGDHSEMAIWNERFAQLKVKASGDETVGSVIAKFLDHKSGTVEMGSLSAGRLDNLRCHLERFENLAGSATPINSIDAPLYLRFHGNIVKSITDKKFTQFYGCDVMKTARQFIRWSHELEILDRLPRNLASKSLVIKIPKKKIQPFTKQEVKQLVDNASDLHRLYYLLMLNCSFTQIDIAELTPSEVDWEKGEITHKRIKTEDEDVPTVTYRLWDETFRLLKELGSQTGDRVFLNNRGRPLVTSKLKTTGRAKSTRTDNLAPAFNVLRAKLSITKSLKYFRKTGPSMLRTKNEYRTLDTLFLGHAPVSMADIHYSQEERFPDDAMEWLGQQFGFSTARYPGHRDRT